MSAATDAEEMTVNETIIERLKGIQEDVAEIKADLRAYNEREVAFQRHYEREHQIVLGKAEAAHRRIDGLEPKVAENADQVKILTNLIQPLISTNKVLIWLGVGFGLSVVALIWAIIIGQAQVVFP